MIRKISAGIASIVLTLSLLVAASCAHAGSDIGREVTAEAAALPTVTIDGNSYHMGTVYIPQAASIYAYTTTMRTDPTVLIHCDHGAILSYVGGGDGVNQQSPHPINNAPYAMGGVEGCQWTAPAHPAANVNVIHTGDAMGMHYKDLHIDGYNAPGDTAILVQNHIYQSEHNEYVGIQLSKNAYGLVLRKDCAPATPACINSFLYSEIGLYCETAVGPAGACLAVEGGGTLLHANVSLRANINGPGSKLIYVDSVSGYYQNNDLIAAEGDSTSGRYSAYADKGGILQLSGLLRFANLTTNPSTIPVTSVPSR